MPRAPSTSASSRASTPYSMPSTQENTNTIKYKVNCYLRVVHRTPWPTSLKDTLKASCFDSDDGRYHCPEANCKSTFDGKRACDFFRHLASFKKHGDKYAYGPVYHCRGTDEGGAPCLFNSTQQSNAKEHIKCVHLKIKTPCPLCPEEFPDAASKSRHVTAVHRDPPSASTSPSLPNKRKNDDCDAEPSEPSRTTKRQKTGTMQVPVKPEPFETSMPSYYKSPLASEGSYISQNWDIDPLLSAMATTSITPVDVPASLDMAWSWDELNPAGFAPLTQTTSTSSHIFPDVQPATVYGADPNNLAIQQPTDLLDALYTSEYANSYTQPLYEPFPLDPLNAYSFDSSYTWGFDNTFQQPLICAPGEYFL